MIPAVIERCAGIAETRKFGTIRADLEKLREWLKRESCTHVVMESTGCYWKPVLNILEQDREYRLQIVLANPQQVKAVTGHKTDPHDAQWLAHLLRHGMIRPSFIPVRPIRELREFMRRRKQMIALAAQERNRVQKILEDANVMLEALVEGKAPAADIAQPAQRNARKKIAELTAALEGHQMRASHRSLIRHAMRHMAFLAEEIDSLDREIEQLIEVAGLTEARQLAGVPDQGIRV